MLQKIFHKLLLRRHFWRHATFSEVAELYVSRMLRMAGLHIAAGFISVYLYQIGHSLIFIALFWAAYAFVKMLVALPSASLIGWIGPKHSIFISNLLYIPALVAIALIPTFGSGLLIVVLLFEAVSTALYTISHGVDFSKVKSVEHAGKEIAFMNIIEKITAGISPLVGGFIAFIFGPEVVMVVGAILIGLAAIPLFKTGEQVKTRQKLKLRGFPWRLLFKHAAGQAAIGFDLFSSGTVWSLFTAIVIIGVGTGNEVYAVAGLLFSVVLLVATASSYIYGRLIDNKRGWDLMQLSIAFKSIVHILRPFIATPFGAAGLNVANEASSTGYSMPYTRALFDNADLSGRRITYLGFVEIFADLGILLATLTFALLLFLFGEEYAFTSYFLIAAVVVLLILTVRFPLYRKS